MNKFIFTSKISRMGSLLRPYVVEITPVSVILRRRGENLISSEENVIPRNKIAGIQIHRHFIGTDIIINGYSSNTLIVLDAFSYSDAGKIKDLLMN